MNILEKISQSSSRSKKLAILIDPGKLSEEELYRICDHCEAGKIDFIFVGGSLIFKDSVKKTISIIKACSKIPVVLFPGNPLQIDDQADAILFLSLISGRNPEMLIGNHVIAAPLLKETGIEVLPTGYMLIDGGRQTAVSYISNTTPIPSDKPELAACTAMAGEMLGLKLIFMDAGSGAKKPVSKEMIAAVKKHISIPLIVGGGISTVEKAIENFEAGADIIVVGNQIEKSPDFIIELSQGIQNIKAGA